MSYFGTPDFLRVGERFVRKDNISFVSCSPLGNNDDGFYYKIGYDNDCDIIRFKSKKECEDDLKRICEEIGIGYDKTEYQIGFDDGYNQCVSDHIGVNK